MIPKTNIDPQIIGAPNQVRLDLLNDRSNAMTAKGIIAMNTGGINLVFTGLFVVIAPIVHC